MYFESFIDGPDKIISSVKFSFSINGKVCFLCGCCLIVFLMSIIFLSNVNKELV